MASLTGQTIASTYNSLLKTSDNQPLTATYKQIEDGLGNGSGLYIGTGGNLGIGRTSPFYNLELNNSTDTRILSYVNNVSIGQIQALSTAYRIASVGTIPLQFYTNGANRLQITDTGAAGFGTPSPSSRLDVYVASGEVTAQISSGTEYVRLFYRDNDDNFGIFINGATRMRFIGTVGNVAMMENGSGNLIIGGAAASAVAKLHVVGSGYFSGSVGFNATTVNASARVQIDSTTQGFLPPRMTSAQRTAISSPAVGLVVYQTDGTEGLYNYKSTGWALV